jgi:hypothetical protein
MRKLVLPVAVALLWALTVAASANAQVLMGDQNLGSYSDSHSAGVAQAFQYTAAAAGNASDIEFYVNSGSTATTVSVGVYSDARGKPGTLLASGSLGSPRSQAWNDIQLASPVSVAQGKQYWIAVLGTGGSIHYLDTARGSAPSYVNSMKKLTSLPQTYSPGTEYNMSPASAYVNGSAGSPGMLLGDQSMAPSADANNAGVAQAFVYRATASGMTTDIDLYLNSGTAASKLLLGVYSDASGKPGTLLASGSLASPKGQAWNDVNVGSVSLTAGSSYWIALLGTGGQIDYPDTLGGSGVSYVESASGLTALPVTYASGSEYMASPASAYVMGMAGSTSPPPAPSNTALPSVSGQTVSGQSLTTSNGSWNNSPTSYAYQWEDCNSSGASCAAISGATGSSYTPASNDVGHTIRSIVTASNAGGSTPATSAATAVITSPPTPAPSNAAPPSVGGQTTAGQSLTTSNGSWNNSPTSYAYQWEDCDTSGANCATISGATGSSYTLTSNDVGHTIRSIVTASNAGGSTPATSAATSMVASAGGGGSAPVNTTGPYFTASTGTTSSCSNGCAVVGQTLAVSNGTWSNNPASFSYQWERCTTTSAQPPTTGSCSAISGATSSSYTVQAADVGHALVPIVTASNSAGASSPTSLPGTCNTGEMLGMTTQSSGSQVPTAQPGGCSPISAVAATTQTGEKFCTNAVTTCGYADPLNQTVGVPAGVTPSTTGVCAAYTNGATISSGTVTINGCKITGQLYITGGTVTIENSDLSLADESGAGAPIVTRGSGTLIAKYDTIHGLNTTSNGSMAWAIYNCCGSPAATLDHVFFYNGDRIFMNLASSSQTPTVTNSFCWSAAQVVFNGSTEHYECIYTQPPSKISVHSTVLLSFHNQTAANYVDDNTGSCCGTVDVENTLLGGGDYALYGGGPQVNTETYLNNRITRAIYATVGMFGLSAYDASATGGSGFTQSGNIFDDTAATATP